MAVKFNLRSSVGFTLIEMAIVLLIFSIMLGGVLAALTTQSRIEKRAELKMKMDAIEQALVSYAINPANAGLPMPADHFTMYSDDCFGRSYDAATCFYNDVNTDGKVFVGTVPVRTLGLPDDYAFDPWGNRFTYKLDIAAAKNPDGELYPFTTEGNAISLTTTGFMSVVNTNGDTIAYPMAAIISHGPNGFGAFTRDAVRVSGYSDNTYEQYNCSCDSGGNYTDPRTVALGAESSDYSSGFNAYDDTVRYYTRSFFLLNNNVIKEN